MGGKGEDVDGLDAKSKKIHPFFHATSKNTAKDGLSSAVTPITPDPSSCSPNSVDNDANTTSTSGGRKRKRTSTDDGQDGKRKQERQEVQDGCGNADNTASISNPPKILKLNLATGTIGSPPKPKPRSHPPSNPPAAVKKKSSRRGARGKSFLVTMTYGQTGDAEKRRVASRINSILAGAPPASAASALPNPSTPPSSRDTDQGTDDDDDDDDNDDDDDDDDNSRRQATPKKRNPRQGRAHQDPAAVPKARRYPTPTLKNPTPKKPTPKKTRSSRTNTTPQKATHPFFKGKPSPNTAVEKQQKPSTKVSHPSSAKPLVRPPFSHFNLPSVGVDTKMLKIPGAQHPAWPWKGMVHVRGGGDDGGGDGGGDEDEYNTQSLPYSGNGETILDTFLLKNRKAKGNQVQIIESESILHQITTKLNITQIAKDLKAYDDDKLQPPPPVLRIPTRHFESGKKLQARISPELKTLRRGHEASKTHPAITYAYDSIQTGSSAFDKTTCESTAWAQKYAPSSAERVLQSGPEAKMLRDWLVTLRVQAVDTGTVDSSTKPKAGAVMAKGKNKRKKKLDGFVVSSDEEDELDEIPDLDGEMLPSGSQSNAKKTLVRSSRQGSRDGGRLANAVVLSGPSGCGKTATVYAIAKELDFEVFEINPSSRRNGKDVLEKVGDMTRNHLVQHRHKEDALQEGAATEDEVDRDLKSGKQGTMTTFFKPKTAPPAGASAAPPTRKTTKTPVEESSSDAKDTKKPAKSQKQSLILLEEVDVLYEEDKQFWATIASMIVQSKRPFVMTCNDEALVPLPMLQSLPLQGIFRFSSPPKDPAVDLLLLIAANEGHALRRHAAETLYDSRGHDLRASITELNFWCQIGVGDMKGGFNWFYPRFPKGKDVDEKGDTIRVVSQDTYQAGMGWLSRDSVADDSPSRSVEEELHQQIGQNWSLDIFDTHQNDSRHHDDFASWVVASSAQCSHRSQNQTILESLDSFSSSLSEADIIGQADFVTMSNQKVMDASIPDLPAKVREDFIIGQQLLEVSPLTRYNTTSADISTTLKSLSRAHTRENSVPSAFEPLDETKATTKLEHYFDESLKEDAAINRLDYCRAFDPIAASEKTMAAGYIDPSVFDGTMKTITLDIAPYVRSIVSFDQRLQRERLQRSSLLSEGGQPGKKKRMRTTRAAYSALEGGTRASTRREKYFSADINPHFVMHTGGKGWDAIAAAATVSPAVASKDATSTRGDAEEVDELADELADEKFD